jgi:hypothetical protein
VTSPAEHAATVRWDHMSQVQRLALHLRVAYERGRWRPQERIFYDALDALVALAARADELERERDEALERANFADAYKYRERAERFEVALLAVKHHPDTPEHLRRYVARAALGEQPQ